jgi:signal transduction histidine kinase
VGAAVVERGHPGEAVNEVVLIAREAISNVGRHCGASGGVLLLTATPEGASLTIADDGVGFDPGRRLGSGHFGLANLRGRAAAIAGTLSIESGVGNGTRIIVRLPFAPAENRQ